MGLSQLLVGTRDFIGLGERSRFIHVVSGEQRRQVLAFLAKPPLDFLNADLCFLNHVFDKLALFSGESNGPFVLEHEIRREEILGDWVTGCWLRVNGYGQA